MSTEQIDLCVSDNGIRDYKKRPWYGAFPEILANEIALRYGFKACFPLRERLSELAWKYQRRSALSPDEKLRVARNAVEESRKTQKINSMYSAVEVALWKINHSSAYGQLRGNQLALIARVSREVSSLPRCPGRARDMAKLFLFRSLGAIYEDGTGRRPTIGRSITRSPKGRAYRFVCDICRELNVKPTPRFLREVGYRRAR